MARDSGARPGSALAILRAEESARIGVGAAGGGQPTKPCAAPSSGLLPVFPIVPTAPSSSVKNSFCLSFTGQCMCATLPAHGGTDVMKTRGGYNICELW